MEIKEGVIRLGLRPRLMTTSSIGSFENEALENEDRSTKHPKLENEAPKTRKRSTQNSKTKHPNLENEAPYLENEAPKTRKRSTQNSKTKTPKSRKRSTLDRKRSTQKLETGLSFINTSPMLIQQESSTITNSPVPHHRAWSQAVILEQILPGSDLI